MGHAESIWIERADWRPPVPACTCTYLTGVARGRGRRVGGGMAAVVGGVCTCRGGSGQSVSQPTGIDPGPQPARTYAAGFSSPDGAELAAGPRKACTPTTAEPANRRAALRRSRWPPPRPRDCCRGRAMWVSMDLSESID